MTGQDHNDIPDGFYPTKSGLIRSIPKILLGPKHDIDAEVGKAIHAYERAHEEAEAISKAEGKAVYNKLFPKLFKRYSDGPTPILGYAAIAGAVLLGCMIAYSYLFSKSSNYTAPSTLTQAAPTEYSAQLFQTPTLDTLVSQSPTPQNANATTCSYYYDNTIEYNILYNTDQGFRYRSEQLMLYLNWVYGTVTGNNIPATHSDPLLNNIPVEDLWNIGVYMRYSNITNAKDLTIAQLDAPSSKSGPMEDPILRYLCGFSP